MNAREKNIPLKRTFKFLKYHICPLLSLKKNKKKKTKRLVLSSLLKKLKNTGLPFVSLSLAFSPSTLIIWSRRHSAETLKKKNTQKKERNFRKASFSFLIPSSLSLCIFHRSINIGQYNQHSKISQKARKPKCLRKRNCWRRRRNCLGKIDCYTRTGRSGTKPISTWPRYAIPSQIPRTLAFAISVCFRLFWFFRVLDSDLRFFVS